MPSSSFNSSTESAEQSAGAGREQQDEPRAESETGPPAYKAPPAVGPRPQRPRREKPTPPTLHVNALALPALISRSTYVDRLARWSDPELPKSDLPHLPDPPPWSLWMEGYYGMYHPQTWDLLEQDQEAEKEYCMGLAIWRMQREEADAGQDELDLMWTEMIEVQRRMFHRFRRLFGLHYVRRRFLDYHQRFFPHHSEAQILLIVCHWEEYPPCSIARHSVWPLPLPPPPRDPRLAPLIELNKLGGDTSLQPYILPGIDSLYFRTTQTSAPNSDQLPSYHAASTPSAGLVSEEQAT